MLAMHQLNSPTQERIRIAKCGDKEMIGAASTSAPNHVPSPIVQHPVSTREPRIALPEKFDGTRSKFRGFINQVQLAIELQPQSYPTPRSQVRFIGTLLSGSAHIRKDPSFFFTNRIGAPAGDFEWRMKFFAKFLSIYVLSSANSSCDTL